METRPKQIGKVPANSRRPGLGGLAHRRVTTGPHTGGRARAAKRSGHPAGDTRLHDATTGQ
ncbi:MAG: hypothetical protein OEX04_16855, partial [Acidimicrobiia bacterium]|nr:hypothetical protein [Acidimicrobiia bacterium]